MDRRDLMTAWGFAADPFTEHIAEQEERLERSFVAPNDFEKIVGDPEHPRPAFVFGSRGEGKSTMCRMVMQRLEALERPPLIVNASDFSEWSVDEIERGLALQDHVRRILRASAIALVETLEANPLPLLGLSRRERASLRRFVARLLPLVDDGSHEHRLARLIEQVNGDGTARRSAGLAIRWVSRFLRRKRFEFEGNELKSEHVGALLGLLTLIAPASPGTRGGATIQAIFNAFVLLVRRLGFPSMYVLVDRVDDMQTVGNRPDRVAKLVASLVGSVAFLESEGLGIKIFLPQEARRDLPGLRTDRIRTYQIEWDERRLGHFLRQRVTAYSRGEELDGIEHVIDDYPAFEREVFRASAYAPRNLLRILDLIVSKHCNREGGGLVIGHEDVEAGVRTFRELRKQEADLELYEARVNRWDLEHGTKNDP